MQNQNQNSQNSTNTVSQQTHSQPQSNLQISNQQINNYSQNQNSSIQNIEINNSSVSNSQNVNAINLQNSNSQNLEINNSSVSNFQNFNATNSQINNTSQNHSVQNIENNNHSVNNFPNSQISDIQINNNFQNLQIHATQIQNIEINNNSTNCLQTNPCTNHNTTDTDGSLVQNSQPIPPPPTEQNNNPTQASQQNPNIQTPTIPIYCSIPYEGLIESEINAIFRKFHIIPAWRPFCQSNSIFSKVKDRIPFERTSGVVYKIDCANCMGHYVGQTSQTLKKRVGQHDNSVRKNEPHHSGLTAHAIQTGHKFSMDNVSILHAEKNEDKRLILESLYIKKHETNILNANTPSSFAVKYFGQYLQ